MALIAPFKGARRIWVYDLIDAPKHLNPCEAISDGTTQLHDNEHVSC
jgi:hypothetical protein